MNIGGNVIGHFLTKSTTAKNDLGEAISEWTERTTKIGFLDFSNGAQSRDKYMSKLEDSTHSFMCDFDAEIETIRYSDLRMIINGRIYDVLMVDNVMELNSHYEISLKLIGYKNV